MYKNRISRPTNNRRPQFFIPRSDFATDERVAYVESVCAVLLESRFGPGDNSPWIFDWNGQQELEPELLCHPFDAEPNGFAPPARLHALSPLGRAVQVAAAAYRKAKQMELLAAEANAGGLTTESCSNQGRGSPHIKR